MEREIRTLLQSLSSEWAKHKNEKVYQLLFIERESNQTQYLLFLGQESRRPGQWLFKKLWI